MDNAKRFNKLLTTDKSLLLIIDILSGSNHLFDGLSASYHYFLPAAIISMGSFFGLVLYIRALGIGKASIVQAVRSTTIIFSIPVSLVLSSFGIIAAFSVDPTLLIIKIIGIILMILGIISFALNLVKAYIFITIKPGYSVEQTFQELWKIRGVSHVTATAGTYDFIVKIQIRALVKGYEKIIRKIEHIEAIEKFKWESVLKEWEHI